MQENTVKSNNIQFGQSLYFQTGNDIERYLVDGWSTQEKIHRWVDGECARLQFHIPELKAKDIVFRVECSGYLALGQLDHQSIDVLVNGRKVANWIVNQRAWFETIVPNELVKNGDMCVSLLISNPIAPIDFNLSQDRRKLGLCFFCLEIIESSDIKLDTPQVKINANVATKKNVNEKKRSKNKRRNR